LEAVELEEHQIVGYSCLRCGANYDTDVWHDFNKQQHYWIGKLRNPKYWQLNNATFEDGLIELERREKSGIPMYLGTYRMEEIIFPKK